MITPDFVKWYDSLSMEEFQALSEEYDGNLVKAYNDKVCNDEVSKGDEYYMEMEREDNE
jgi:hypothetical protein